MKKLNIGSGEFLKEGYANVGFYSETKPDVMHDLSSVSDSFEDNYVDLIESDCCPEPLPNPFAGIKKIYRIAKPVNGGNNKGSLFQHRNSSLLNFYEGVIFFLLLSGSNEIEYEFGKGNLLEPGKWKL